MPAQKSGIRVPWRVVASCAVGSIFEYYDFFIYGPLAVLVFPQVFFPASLGPGKTLLAISTFVVGFAARPVGGIVFGHWGDRIGRKPMLVATFTITGLSTFAVGFLPTYAQIGIAAPVLLTALRIVQGFGLGGEWSGAAMLAAEHSEEGNRGFAGSLVQAGAPIGVITATLAVALVSGWLGTHGLIAWGWRLPFFASFALVVVGLFLRMRVEESPEFTAVQERKATPAIPVVAALRRAPGRILCAIAVHTADVTIAMVLGVFVLGYATHVLHFSPTIVLIALISGSIANLIVAPIAGRWTDIAGASVVLLTGCALMALWSFPIFALIHRFGIAGVFCAIIGGQIIISIIFSPLAAYFRELFAAEIRYTASSIGFQVATILGASSPLIAQALQNGAHGATWPISLYFVAIAFTAAACVLAMRSKLRVSPTPHPCCAPMLERVPAERIDAPARLIKGRPDVGALRLVPAGSFLMGGNDQDAFPQDGEGPVREVRLSPYQISPTAVRNDEFARFAEATGYATDAERYGWSFVFYAQVHPEALRHIIDARVPSAPWWLGVRGASWRAPDGPGSSLRDREAHPVVHVSWNDAAAYAAWCGARLPTEAEWECAARGGLEQNRFPWGNELLPNGEHRCNIWQGTFPDVNLAEDGYLSTAPVETFEPNGFGLYCVSGNVWEWCADWWSADWHATASGATRIDPRGPDKGTAHVIRGGSYLCHESYCNRYRVAARTFNAPDGSTSHMGFRLARSVR